MLDEYVIILIFLFPSIYIEVAKNGSCNKEMIQCKEASDEFPKALLCRRNVSIIIAICVNGVLYSSIKKEVLPSTLLPQTSTHRIGRVFMFGDVVVHSAALCCTVKYLRLRTCLPSRFNYKGRSTVKGYSY